MAGYYIKLIDTAGDIHRKVSEALAAGLDDRIKFNLYAMEKEIKRITGSYFRNDPRGVYKNIVDGELRGHLGIPAGEAEQRLENIINTIVQNIELKYVPVRYSYPNLTGGLELGVLLRSFEDVLSLDSGFLIINVKSNRDQAFKIDWLRWMLTEGNNMIVFDWDFEEQANVGRSLKGHMVPSPNGAWSVPDYAAGTLNDNWLSRAITEQSSAYIREIGKIMAQYIGSGL